MSGEERGTKGGAVAPKLKERRERARCNSFELDCPDCQNCAKMDLRRGVEHVAGTCAVELSEIEEDIGSLDWRIK